MGHFAVIDDGDRLEPAVRVLADPARGVGGAELGRAGVVQQQERAELAAVGVVGEQRTDREAVADPVRAGGAVEAADLLHVFAPVAARVRLR
jgi:hypothetical protein